MDEVDRLLERWLEAGLITPSQSEAIRRYEGETAPAAPVARPPEAPEAPEAAAPPPRPVHGRELPSFGLGADVTGIDLRTLGLLLAALALLALLGNIFSVLSDLFIGPGTRIAPEVEDVLHLIASVCGLVGGLRLVASHTEGKTLVYWSLGINLVATLLLSGAGLRQPWTIASLVVWVLLAVLTWRARYRGRYRFF